MVDDNATPDNPSDDFAPTFVSGDNNSNGVLDRNETWLYRATSTAAPGLRTNVARVTGTAGGRTHTDDDPASVYGWFVEVDLQKATNAVDRRHPTVEEDADAAPGLIVIAGTPVVWTYLVTNTGNIAVTVALRDDAGSAVATDDFTPLLVDGDANGNGKLDPGETWLYTSAGVVTYVSKAGQYVNVATLTATGPDGTPTTQRERSHHFGATTPLELVKSVNPVDPFTPTSYEDADFAPGVILPTGSLITWSYVLRNGGTQPLAVVGIQDDGGVAGSVAFVPDPVLDALGFNVGDVDRDGLLDPGEAWLYRSGTHTVGAGQYTNTATAFAMFHGVTPALSVTATDVANIFGSLGIAITKAVNGSPADTVADALYVKAGGPVTWTYAVTTTAGSIANVVVTDDAGTPGIVGDDFAPTFTGGDSNGNGMLDPGETWTYPAAGIIPAGLYLNVARVQGLQGGITVREDDVAHAFGSAPGVSIAKALNALNPLAPTELEDADGPLTPELLAGATVVFTYLVRNTGNIRVLVDKSTGLVDDHGTLGLTGDDFTGVYVSGDVNGDGWLDLGETWLFRSPTLVVSGGSYTNTGTVTGTEPRTAQTVTASDIARYFGRTGAEGLTPGFWKTNVDTKNAIAWPRTSDGALVLDPLQPVSSLFAGLPPIYANLTLAEGLGVGGGGIEALLRHAIAAVLNATHPWVAYPLSASEVIALTNAAIAVRRPDHDRDAQEPAPGLQRARVRPRRKREHPAAELSVQDVSVTEGNAGSSTVLVTIVLSGPALGPVSVGWATANGSATAGSDYLAASGTVTFAAGESAKTVAITILGDTSNEGNEAFSVRLSNAAGAAVDRASASVTIVNDDGPPSVTVAATDASGAETGTNPIVLTLTRSGSTASSLAVNVAFGGTASSSDYTLTVTGGTLVGSVATFAAGSATVDGDGDPGRRRARRECGDSQPDGGCGQRVSRRRALECERLGRRQRCAAALDRRPDRDRGQREHDHRDRDGAAVGAGDDRGDGDGDDGGRIGAGRQRLPGEDRDRDLRCRSDNRQLPGQRRQQPHDGAD